MRKIFILGWISLMMLLSLPLAVGAQAEDDLKKADQGILQAVDAAQSGKLEEASKLFDTFQATWLAYEDGVKSVRCRLPEDRRRHGRGILPNDQTTYRSNETG